MSNRVILRQIAIAVCIFVCIAVIDEIETPWSVRVKGFLRHSVSQESNWNLKNLSNLQIAKFDLGLDFKKWTEELSSSLQNELHSISIKFKEQLQELILRWTE